MASLTDRMAQAPTVDRLAGRQVTPLKPDEARILGDMLERMPIPERTRFLGGVGKVIGGRRLEDLSRQLGAKNNELGIAAAMQAHGFKAKDGRTVAELYLEGADAIKNGRVKTSTAEGQQIRADVYELIGDAYTSPQAREAAVDVAMNLWARGEVAGKSIKPKEAVPGDRRHHRMERPQDADALRLGRRRVRAAVRRVDHYTLATAAGGTKVRVGDTEMRVEDLAQQMPSVQLRSAGANRYAIQVGTGSSRVPDGRPFAISLEKR